MATILLAEDDAVLQDMYQERLAAAGYKVLTAGNGQAALKLMAEKPDLVILDIMMPQLNGIDVLKKLKADEATKNIPLIVATALVQDMTELKTMLGEKDAYVIKSEVTPAEIIQLVRSKLEGGEAGTATAPRE